MLDGAGIPGSDGSGNTQLLKQLQKSTVSVQRGFRDGKSLGRQLNAVVTVHDDITVFGQTPEIDTDCRPFDIQFGSQI